MLREPGIVGRSDEIGVLGQTFDRLMDENAMREEQRATAEERREILVHELAHRVKNTLATVQSIASLSFRHSQGPEALRQFHERLQALVRGHDLLTRKNWQHASLSEIAEAAMAPMHQERGHRVAISGPAGGSAADHSRADGDDHARTLHQRAQIRGAVERQRPHHHRLDDARRPKWHDRQPDLERERRANSDAARRRGFRHAADCKSQPPARW